MFSLNKYLDDQISKLLKTRSSYFPVLIILVLLNKATFRYNNTYLTFIRHKNSTISSILYLFII